METDIIFDAIVELIIGQSQEGRAFCNNGGGIGGLVRHRVNDDIVLSGDDHAMELQVHFKATPKIIQTGVWDDMSVDTR